MNALRSSFAAKMLVLFLGGLLLSMGLAGTLITRRVKSQFTEELAMSLKAQGQLLASQTDPSLLTQGPNLALQKLALSAASAVRARVTFISASGVVLADSDLHFSDLAKVENHADRPEIRHALNGEKSWEIRHSHTVGRSLLYQAVFIPSKAGPLGVVRLAENLDSVQDKLNLVRTNIWHLSLTAGLMGAALVLWVAWSVRGRLKELTHTAERLSRGDFGARADLSARDEFGTLSGTLNYLGEKVQQTVEALSRDKTQLAAILSNMVESVVAVDQTGKILAVNPALTALFGLHSIDVVGQKMMESLRHSQLNELLTSVLREGRARIEEIRTFDPVDRLFEAHAVPLKVDGVQQGALLVLHDITRLRQLEQIRRDFVANVSHELRTPLAAIRGFAETLKMGAVDDKEHRDDFLSGIESHTEQMTRLIDDLLDLAAIESGKRAPQRTSFSLVELAGEVIHHLQPLALRKKVHLDLSAGDDPVTVPADRIQIKQVLTNLIENAIKFNKPEGRVDIRIQTDGALVSVSVKDTGVGIPAAALPRVFERFFRVDKARSRDMGGTGLGLAIVKHIIEAHRGSVGVDSQDGRGSTFYFKLPL